MKLCGTALLFIGLQMFMVGKTLAAELKVCADPNNPPFSERKGGGFENAIAELIARDQGLKLSYTWFPQRMGFVRSTLKSQDPETGEFKCDVIMGVPTRSDVTATTDAYYRSTYALIYVAKNWAAIPSLEAVAAWPKEAKSAIRMAMYDGSPATTWMLKHDLIEQGVPYQSMGGDASINTAQQLIREFKDGRINMALVWGPIASHVVRHLSAPKLVMLPVRSEEGVTFEYSMSMGVRYPDKDRKAMLNGFIQRNQSKINAILEKSGVPLLEVPHETSAGDAK